MDRREVLKKLKNLWDTKSVLEKNGPNSGPGSNWLAEARAHIQVADPALGADFAHYMSFVGLPLSSYTLGPIWINMQGILRTAIAKVEAECPPAREKIYAPGEAFDVYRDLSELVAAASKEVFIADPYADQEIFELYLSRVPKEVQVRLLTKQPSSALKTVASKFAARPGGRFEARSTALIHDRVIIIDGRDCWVIGQSIKDAGMKKPTYLLPVSAVSDMAKLYEDAWRSGTPY